MDHRPQAPSAGRDPRLNLLKVLGSVGVILVHTSVHTLNARETHGWVWWLADLGNTLGRNMSSLFAMVAGAVLLRRLIEDAPLAFIRQRMARLLPAVVFWSAFYLAWRKWRGEPLGAWDMFKQVAYGSPYYHLWFLFAMLGLYLLMPGVRLMVRDNTPAARNTQYLTATILMLATWASVVATTAVQTGRLLFISYTPLLLVYLVCGFLFYRDEIRVPLRWLTVASILCTAATMLIVYLLEPGANRRDWTLIIALRAPLLMGWVFLVFLWCMHCTQMPAKLAIIMQELAAITLGIYALHPFWIDAIDRWLWPIARSGAHWVPAAVAVFALSAASSWLISRIPPLRRLVC